MEMFTFLCISQQMFKLRSLFQVKLKKHAQTKNSKYIINMDSKTIYRLC